MATKRWIVEHSQLGSQPASQAVRQFRRFHFEDVEADTGLPASIDNLCKAPYKILIIEYSINFYFFIRDSSYSHTSKFPFITSSGKG